MRNNRLSLVCAGLMLALTLAWSGPALGQTTSDAFAGTWNVTVTPDSATLQKGGMEFTDAMVFQQQETSELLTENFAYLGFNSGAYTIPADKPLEFAATMESGTKGSLAWSGAVANGLLHGTLVWTKPDGVVWTFAFSGRK
jgi:hypothetical protein